MKTELFRIELCSKEAPGDFQDILTYYSSSVEDAQQLGAILKDAYRGDCYYVSIDEVELDPVIHWKVKAFGRFI